MSDYDKATEIALREKYNALVKDLTEVENSLTRLRDKRSEIQAKLRDAAAAARLFGVQLPANFAPLPEEPKPEPATLQIVTPASGQFSPVPYGGTTKPTVRELVLDMLRTAYPQPLRARSIRERLAIRHHIVMHEKTVGMTLYRLSLSHLAKRDGFDWYFLPENERPAENEKGQERNAPDPFSEDMLQPAPVKPVTGGGT